ncbi:MAG: DUF1800 domain-containing protein [Pseudomonadota bacterium]
MKQIERYAALLSVVLVASCNSGGGDTDDSSTADGSGSSGTPARETVYPVDTQEAVKFLNQASFGGSADDIASVEAQGLETWIYEQSQLPIVSFTDRLIAADDVQDVTPDVVQALFWERAVHADDQLRQRVTFALSQIVVASLADGAVSRREREYGVYLDILQRHALGNYCDMVREISFNPVMGLFLTHLGNRKADAATGFVPDENYAREVMQLFTIGLEVLNSDGTGQGTETYTLEDVQGLAAVFTGLSWADTDFERPRIGDNNRYLPMESYIAEHEDGPKSFLGTTVDLGGDAEVSVDEALDYLLAHQNVAPFISQQLIQKLVTSNPSPSYVSRVASVFTSGSYVLPDGRMLGTGQRCDMAATVAAILLDDEARGAAPNENFGKLRSPVLRMAQYLRAFRIDQELTTTGAVPRVRDLVRLEETDRFGQNAFSSPSVFNFFRPGYVAPGTESADLGLKTPEFQLATTPSLIGYINTMESFIDGFTLDDGTEYVDRSKYLELAGNAAELVDALDVLLTGGTLSAVNRDRIVSAVELYDMSRDSDALNRLEMALMLMITSPEYLVQR